MEQIQLESAHHQVIDVAGLGVHVSTLGSGPCVVVLHRSTGRVGFEAFLESLAEHFTVVAPDLPGFGLSERPDWARAPRDLSLLLLRGLDRLTDEPLHLVGTGFGGWVAAEMVVMDPQRFSALTLVGPAGLKPRTGEILDQMMLEHQEYMRVCFSGHEAFEKYFADGVSPAFKESWDFGREMTARVTWRPWMFSRQLPHTLVEFTAPALILRGAEDHVIPADCAVRYAELLPAAELRELAGVGHVVELESPESLVAEILRHPAAVPLA